MATGIAPSVGARLDEDVDLAVVAYDGSRAGPTNPAATLAIRSPAALQRMLTAPRQLGLVRAFVAGDVEIEGDIFVALDALSRADTTFDLDTLRTLVRGIGGWRNIRFVERPPEEVSLRGRRHSKARDRAAIDYHYSASNEFYGIVLGPSLTYSCAVFRRPDDTLEEAQAAKHELVCRKLGLRAGDRLLDIGCGWGSMVLHAARHHGVEAVGVTVSEVQAEAARKRVATAGLSDRVTIRLQDYREIEDGPYDAISSIGMFEHVGRAQLDDYFGRLHGLLPPGGRLLNHGIARLPGSASRRARRGFVQRYVFPDSELHEIGEVVSAVQRAGLEVRHTESLREHYALTLRRWVANLEDNWDDAVAEIGVARARIWRLQMAGGVLYMDKGLSQIHQVLAVRRHESGASGMPLRPAFG